MSAEQVLIAAAELHEQLGKADAPLLLDVRWRLGSPDGRLEFEQGHIPGAVFADLDTELAAPASALSGRHPLPAVEDLQTSARGWGLRRGQAAVVYDDSGGMAAARAWWLLRWAGVEDVKILDGALTAWKRKGFPMATGAGAPGAGDVSLSAGHMPVLSADDTACLAAGGLVLDARAAERYRGEVEPIDQRSGHIPGAVSAPTTDNLAADGSFLDEQALAARFAGLGADSRTDVGVYCGSGVTAAHLVAALQIAGIRAALFAGSWSAWSADPQRPVAVGAMP